MKIIIKENNKYVLRFNRGEEVISLLKEFCKEENILSASFTGIGAVNQIKLGWYDVENKEYERKEFQEKLEIISLIGNVSKMEEEIIVHVHGNFASRDFKSIAGHVDKMIVSATCEIVLEKFETPIERERSEEIGLNLMK
jgi:predicted DNA-binding protein with PD1-like motif